MTLVPLIEPNWWTAALLSLAFTHVTIVAVTVYLHRHQAHRALELHPVVAHFFRLWLWLSTGMATREWAAVHRKHHARVETAEDPHSPQVNGSCRVLRLGPLPSRRAAHYVSTREQHGRGTPDDWIERKVYARHNVFGIVIMLGVDVLLLGPVAGAVVWAVQMAWIPFWAAGVINGVGHWFGYRNYETRDASRNIVPIGIIIGGEELHNNHHAYASSARFSIRPFEFDIGWTYIRLLAALGLARVQRTVPSLAHDPVKSRCDLETVNAVVTNRFQVMADFFDLVVKRVYREELKRLRGRAERGMVKRAVNSLLHPSASARAAAAHVHDYLDLCPRLRFVLAMKTRLQDTWASAQGSPELVRQRLEEWCAQAEDSGIAVLRDFSRHLRGYRLAAA